MGCENSVVTPGISSNTSSICFISSSLESAEVHSSLSFNRMIISPASMGIGSVGISAEPILVTIILISGKRFFNSFSAFVVVSTSWESELPEAMMTCVAISPSSKVGMNSPPNLPNTMNAMSKRTTAIPTTMAFIFKAPSNIGR
ncbi:hypothetical protein D3C71_728340 [compost metagenome]